jgi:hypothetical protein
MKTLYTAYDADEKMEVQVKYPWLRKLINRVPQKSNFYALKIIYGEGGSKRKTVYPGFPGMLNGEELVKAIGKEGLDLPEKIKEDVGLMHIYLPMGRDQLLEKIKRKLKHIRYLTEQFDRSLSIEELKKSETALINRVGGYRIENQNLERINEALRNKKEALESEIKDTRMRCQIEQWKDRKVTARDKEMMKLLHELAPRPSKRRPGDKIIGGSVEHHRPKGYENFVKKLSYMDVIDTIRPVRTCGKTASGLRRVGGEKFEVCYSDGSFGVVVEVNTIGENEAQYVMVEKVLRNELGI